MILSSKAEALIISFEGWDVPWKWPGQSSGITLPIGYDLGYEPFEKDWAGLLAQSDFQRLRAVQGLKGDAARVVAPSLRGIIIPRSAATKVFDLITMPRYIQETIGVFPKSDQLPSDAFGALVSLVYNRGTKLDGPRRTEMASIRDACIALIPSDIQRCLLVISSLILSMRRLWPDNPASDGDLFDRRTQEAALVKGCLAN